MGRHCSASTNHYPCPFEHKKDLGPYHFIIETRCNTVYNSSGRISVFKSSNKNGKQDLELLPLNGQEVKRKT
ncbi:MAG: hypothetical protein EOP43_07775 [Sphingobacteriaceae bacterium]|nr:MAG: hypothetical protein EOP43_07775 [Sphingobacteriaceae bacterium]